MLASAQGLLTLPTGFCICREEGEDGKAEEVELGERPGTRGAVSDRSSSGKL